MSKLESIFSEAELLKYLNLSKSQLTVLREDGLRFIRVNRTVRLYAEESVVAFLMARERQHSVIHRPKSDEDDDRD